VQPAGGQQDAGALPPKPSSLPISERSFYIGLVPTPKSAQGTTFEDLTAAYEEAGNISEVSMVWPASSGIGQYDQLNQSRVITAVRVYGLKPVVTLNFATMRQVPGKGIQYVIDAPAGVNANLSDPEFRRLWVDEARKIAQEFRPEYFSLGNEINDYFYLHPEELDAYLSLYDEARSAIKNVSPETKVFVVFSYNHLIENDQWDMIETFSNRSDLIGLTTYPAAGFDAPGDIPTDYYTRLNNHTDKPTAFTEIGWPSSGTGSEDEQAEFLVRFLELTEGMDLEMVNWLFLHEPQLTGIAASISQPGTSTVSLKNADGTRKKIYALWLDLKDLRIVK